jgi:ABC-type lipoprotein release transport system permease subunit
VFDWEAFAIAFSAVGIAAMFACLTPAMRAMLIESLKALKE